MREAPRSPVRRLNAYVSASSRGVAFEIARRLAISGNDVALSSRNASHLDAARTAILTSAPQARVLTVSADVRRVDDQERVFAQLEREGFVPDILVCGAGHPRARRLSSFSRSDWQSDLEMILGQAAFATQKLAPAMAEQGFGRLIFLSSIYAKAPDSGYCASSIARSGLFALSKIVTDEYASRGVASFVICLGFVDTPMVRNLALGRPLEESGPMPVEAAAWSVKYEEWAERIPAKRIASPSELADFVAYLISPAADYLNGNVFSFSGGLDRNLV